MRCMSQRGTLTCAWTFRSRYLDMEQRRCCCWTFSECPGCCTLSHNRFTSLPLPGFLLRNISDRFCSSRTSDTPCGRFIAACSICWNDGTRRFLRWRAWNVAAGCCGCGAASLPWDDGALPSDGANATTPLYAPRVYCRRRHTRRMAVAARCAAVHRTLWPLALAPLYWRRCSVFRPAWATLVRHLLDMLADAGPHPLHYRT